MQLGFVDTFFLNLFCINYNFFFPQIVIIASSQGTTAPRSYIEGRWFVSAVKDSMGASGGWLISTMRGDVASMRQRPLWCFCPGRVVWQRRSGFSTPLNFHRANDESPSASSTNYLKVNGLQFLHLHKFLLRSEPNQFIFIGHGRGSHSGGSSSADIHRSQKAPSGTRPLTVSGVASPDWPVDSTLLSSHVRAHERWPLKYETSDGPQTSRRVRHVRHNYTEECSTNGRR